MDTDASRRVSVGVRPCAGETVIHVGAGSQRGPPAAGDNSTAGTDRSRLSKCDTQHEALGCCMPRFARSTNLFARSTGYLVRSTEYSVVGTKYFERGAPRLVLRPGDGYVAPNEALRLGS